MTEVGPYKQENVSDKAQLRHSRLEFVGGLAVAVIVVIWLLFFIDRIVMPLIAFSGVERRVPDLHYLLVNEADSLCKSLELEMVISRYRVEKKQLPGTVLDQFPIAGSVVKPGHRIEVVVIEQELSVRCPNVVEMSPREASIIASSYGLIVNDSNIRYWHSSSTPEGIVTVQQPNAGEELIKGTELILTVSLGKSPDRIVAPDLKGRKVNDIRLILAKYRLRLGKVTHFPDSSVPQGTILSQDPPAGTPMEASGLVNVRSAVKPRSEH